MNEQQNTNLIKKVYEAFATGDLQTILDTLTSDVEWDLEGPAIIPFAGKRTGIPQVKQFFEALATTQVDARLTTSQFVAQGDLVATFGRYAATVKATGRRVDSPVGHFFTIRNGKISRFVDLIDTAAMADAYRQASTAAR